MADRSQERPLFIAPKEIALVLLQNGSIGMRIGPPHPDLGFAPNIVLAVELSPAESRDLAIRLMHMADEAEAA